MSERDMREVRNRTAYLDAVNRAGSLPFDPKAEERARADAQAAYDAVAKRQQEEMDALQAEAEAAAIDRTKRAFIAAGGSEADWAAEKDGILREVRRAAAVSGEADPALAEAVRDLLNSRNYQRF